MAKLFVLAFFVSVAAVLAEPPSSYLPPQARNAPSSQYGAPGGGFGTAAQSRGSTSFHSQRFGSQSFSYNSEHKPSQIGVSRSQNAEHESFGASRASFDSTASSAAADGRYNGLKVPQQQGALARTFSAPSQSNFPPNPIYGSPSQGQASDGGFGSATRSRIAASNAGLSSAEHGFSSVAGASSGTYRNFGQGLSSAGQGLGSAQAFSAPSNQYGPPSSQYGAPFASRMNDDFLSEPANYEYNYQVLAVDESGAEFGHQEARQNEAAKGQYHVLLPDGRMQIVEYEADEQGFRPNIRYEETGRYPSARNNGHAGFGGPY